MSLEQELCSLIATSPASITPTPRKTPQPSTQVVSLTSSLAREFSETPHASLSQDVSLIDRSRVPPPLPVSSPPADLARAADDYSPPVDITRSLPMPTRQQRVPPPPPPFVLSMSVSLPASSAEEATERWSVAPASQSLPQASSSPSSTLRQSLPEQASSRSSLSGKRSFVSESKSSLTDNQSSLTENKSSLIDRQSSLIDRQSSLSGKQSPPAQSLLSRSSSSTTHSSPPAQLPSSTRSSVKESPSIKQPSSPQPSTPANQSPDTPRQPLPFLGDLAAAAAARQRHIAELTTKPPSQSPSVKQSPRSSSSFTQSPQPSSIHRSSTPVSQSPPPNDTPRQPLPFLGDLAAAAAARQRHIAESTKSSSPTPQPTPQPTQQPTQQPTSQSTSQPTQPARLPTNLLQEIAAAGTKRLHHVEAQSPVGTLGSRAGTIRKRGTLGGGGRGGERYGTEVFNRMRTTERSNLYVGEDENKQPAPSGNPLLDEIRSFDLSKLKKVQSAAPAEPKSTKPKEDADQSLADFLRSRLEVMEDSESDSDSSDSRFDFSDFLVC